MLGAIIGDIVGSPYELRGNRIKSIDFPLFSGDSRPTDDTVLTVATAVAIQQKKPYGVCYHNFGRHYPAAGYGHRFLDWLRTDGAQPFGSLGNGSAMRVSPIAWYFDDMDTVRDEASKSAACTHNHPEGIKGAVATAMLIRVARHSKDKELMKSMMEQFGYETNIPVDEIRPTHRFDATCPGTVPEAFRCVYEANSYEEAVRLAVSLGGDADTLACIAGSVAEALWPIPEDIFKRGWDILSTHTADIARWVRMFFILQGVTDEKEIQTLDDPHGYIRFSSGWSDPTVRRFPAIFSSVE